MTTDREGEAGGLGPARDGEVGEPQGGVGAVPELLLQEGHLAPPDTGDKAAGQWGQSAERRASRRERK